MLRSGVCEDPSQPRNQCRDVNKVAFKTAFDLASDEAKERYLTKGRQMMFGEDYISPWGPGWEYSLGLDYNTVSYGVSGQCLAVDISLGKKCAKAVCLWCSSHCNITISRGPGFDSRARQEKKVPMNTLVCSCGSFVEPILQSFLRRSDPCRGITSPWRAILGWAKATKFAKLQLLIASG